MTGEAWLRAHPYLEPVARLCAVVDDAVAGLGPISSRVPSWDDYIGDYRAGVPLLRSASAMLDLEPAGALVPALAEHLARAAASDRLAADARILAGELGRESGIGRRVVDWLLGGETVAPSSPGLLRFLGWKLMARYLEPVVESFARWRDEDQWLRCYCPTCGSLPAMAHLVGVDPGRLRLLSCACCGTRWRFLRTACPFCERDDQQLAALAVEGEGGLRIDYCRSCRGYLKTYGGQGNDDLFLADWTSLHLDVLASDRGLVQRAASLYDLGVGSQRER